MMKEGEDKLISNLKEKMDSLIQKGIELSKGLSAKEQNSILKKVIDESVDKAIENLMKSGEQKYTKEELLERKEKIRLFIEKYYEERINVIQR